MTFQTLSRTLRSAFVVGACALAFVGCDNNDPDEDENPSNIDIDALQDTFGSGGDNIVDCASPTIREIDLDDTASGELSSSDCSPGGGTDNSYVDLYAFEVTDDNTDITVTVSSNDFNPFVYLYDENGNELGFDNPSDTGDASISDNLDSGVYVIYVNSDTTDPEVGDYTVELDSNS